MKTTTFASLLSILFALSFQAHSQRIDFGLNHQKGIEPIEISQILVDESGDILVCYKANSSPGVINYCISGLYSNGQVLTTMPIYDYGPGRNFRLGLSSRGLNYWFDESLSFGSNDFYYTYQASGYHVPYLGAPGRDSYSFHADSLSSINLAILGDNYALLSRIKDEKVKLTVGQINASGIAVEKYSTIIDTLPPYWWAKLKWIDENTLSANTSLNINDVQYNFDDSLNYVSEKLILKWHSPVLYHNKLYDLENSFTNEDTLDNYIKLKNGLGNTVKQYNIGRGFWGGLLATEDYLIAMYQKQNIINAIGYDSLVVEFLDSNLKLVNKVVITEPFAPTAYAVSKTGNKVYIGARNYDEVALFALDVNGLITAISPIVGSSKINVFPNPANLNLAIPNVPFGNRIQIYSSIGQLLITHPYCSDINIADLQPGIYFLEVIDKLGTVVGNSKFVKQ